MGKKYLLYIHDERFDLEKKKSKLVNDLLKDHYEDNVYTPDKPVVYTSDDRRVHVPVPAFVDEEADWGA